jgi:hypothetical protein
VKSRRFIIATVILLLAAVWQGQRARRSLWQVLVPPYPRGIVLHHSSSPPVLGGRMVNAAMIDGWHEKRGFGQTDGKRVYHIGYHFVVLRDGSIQRGRPENLRGAHARYANDCIGICVVGNFASSSNPRGRKGPVKPTPEQMKSLKHLIRYLFKKYPHLSAENIYRHRDTGSETDCPGDRFPYRDLKIQMAARQRSMLNVQ